MPLLSAATTSCRQPARASRSLPQSSGKASAEVNPADLGGLVVDPAVVVGEPPTGVLNRAAYIVRLEHRVPPVHTRLDLSRQEGGQSAHRGSSRTTPVDPIQ